MLICPLVRGVYRFVVSGLACLVFSGGLPAALADPAHEVLGAFHRPLYVPITPLTLGADGFLYGSTNGGGVIESGTIYKIRPDGTGFAKVANFRAAAELTPGPGGDLYGVTGGGGANGDGSVFRLTASGLVTTLFSFNDADPAIRGLYPSSALVIGADGWFYGTTQYGGAGTQGGTVYKVSPEGAFMLLAQFSVAADGAEPNALKLGSDGNFYGTTAVGGPGAYGTIFKMTPAGARTPLAVFTGTTGATRGTQPNGLVEAADGNFYGVTRLGGANAEGTIFRVTPAGTLTTVLDFTGSAGAVPGGGTRGALCRGADGALYGTIEGSVGGFGQVFRVTTAGVFTRVVNFAAPLQGWYPDHALTQLADGNFYGVTRSNLLSGLDLAGGTQSYGTVFRLTPAGAVTTLTNFVDTPDGPKGLQPASGLLRAGDGNFYGVTRHGGARRRGTVYRITPGGVITTLVEFTDTTGARLGAFPGATLILGPGGKIWGGTEKGGTGYQGGVGTLFSMDLDGGNFVTHVNFGSVAIPGRAPNSLIHASDGNIYGTTFDSGGSNSSGIFFRYTPGGVFTLLFQFTGTTGLYKGTNPTGPLAEAPGGLIYGTTARGGGPANMGSVYSVSTAGTPAFTTQFAFSGSGAANTGRTPHGLLRATDGNFYGVSADGGGLTRGTVYRMTPGHVVTTLFDASSVGFRPTAALREGADGNFYGAGVHQTATVAAGAVYKITPAGTVTQLVEFSNIGTQLQAGSYPTDAPLVAGTDGKLYGVTASGGAFAGGTVYRIALNDIAVQYPVRTTLTDTVSTVDFGAGQLQGETTRTFTLLNTGNAPLTGFPITFSGPQAAEYTVTAPPAAGPLAAGASTTFTVRLRRLGTGNRRAVMHLGSSAAGALASYDINLTGRGPLTAVNQPPVFLPPDFTARFEFNYTFSLATLLGFVNEPDGDDVFLSGLTWLTAQGGTITFSGGVLTYTPAVGFNGSDSITVSFSDGRGGLVSDTFTIRIVTAAQDIVTGAQIILTPGQAAFSATGTAGLSYTLQFNTDLGANWQNLSGLLTAGSDGAIRFNDLSALPPRKFYRLVPGTPAP